MVESNHVVVPLHIAIIPDGNRRWAKAQGKPVFVGHRAGYDNLKRICEYAASRGVSYLSAYVFSTQNWQRPAREVDFLMDLLTTGLAKDFDWFEKNNFRLLWIGQSDKVNPKLARELNLLAQKTKDFTKATINLCFNYGAREDIVMALRQILREGVSPEQVNEEVVSAHLSTAGIPDPDLIIRTSGEYRLSNFLLWESTYSELYFSAKYWPEFDTVEFELALAEYARRQRRFGR
ncbi:MAG: polyprenyl diphosphate synthase [Candidatus Saccharimonadia bacterium]